MHIKEDMVIVFYKNGEQTACTHGVISDIQASPHISKFSSIPM
jgi:hypothetical protein